MRNNTFYISHFIVSQETNFDHDDQAFLTASSEVYRGLRNDNDACWSLSGAFVKRFGNDISKGISNSFSKILGNYISKSIGNSVSKSLRNDIFKNMIDWKSETEIVLKFLINLNRL